MKSGPIINILLRKYIIHTIYFIMNQTNNKEKKVIILIIDNFVYIKNLRIYIEEFIKECIFSL